MKNFQLVIFLFKFIISQTIQRDIGCEDQSICQDDYSPFLCEFYCPEIHNKIIPSCAECSENRYTEFNDTNDINDLVNSFINYINNQSEGISFESIPLQMISNVDNENNLNVISEINNTSCTTDDSILNYQNGWGTLIHNHNTLKENISIHINHPLSDKNSNFIGADLFELMEPAWMLVAGSHRYAYTNNNYLPCEDENCEDDKKYNHGADVARSINECDNSSYTTPFQKYHEIISDNQDEHISISIHGYNSSNHYFPPASFVITNGVDINGNYIVPTALEKSIKYYLKETFHNDTVYYNACNDAEIAVIVQEETTLCGNSVYDNLGGSKNPQGNYNNIISPNNDRWIQIEMDKCIRDNIYLYQKANQAINQAFDNCIFSENGNDGCYGCTDDLACNYNSEAINLDNSCLYSNLNGECSDSDYCIEYDLNQDLIITEISPKSEPEWIEIYNNSDQSVDLNGYRFVGLNDEGNIKWINFEICNEEYPIIASCGGTSTDCKLGPGKFLIIYEGAGHLPDPEQGQMFGNPECYIDPTIRGFNDLNQPANILNLCGDLDCAHMDGDNDVIAIFSSDPTCGTNGRWNGEESTECDATLMDVVEWYDYSGNPFGDVMNVGDEKSISLIAPNCNNNGLYYYVENILQIEHPNTQLIYPPNETDYNLVIYSWRETSIETPGFATFNGTWNANFYFSDGCIQKESVDFIYLSDVNMDGNINVVDIVLIIEFIMDISDFTILQQELADFNQDGNINVVDIVLIVEFILSPQN